MQQLIGACLMLLGLYTAPAVVARSHSHPYLAPIFVAFNLLLTWTMIDWAAALIWIVMPLHTGRASSPLID
jgi:hypothetical protein